MYIQSKTISPMCIHPKYSIAIMTFKLILDSTITENTVDIITKEPIKSVSGLRLSEGKVQKGKSVSNNFVRTLLSLNRSTSFITHFTSKL